jgi:superoxide reductase
MTKVDEVYKCEICGNVTAVEEAADGVLVCCGQDMKLQETKTAEQEGKEKHVPVLEVDGNKVTVKVGSIEHPMEEEHFIEFIQVLQNGRVVFQKRLKPGEKPEAEFVLANTEDLTAKEYCNKHGLWTN